MKKSFLLLVLSVLLFSACAPQKVTPTPNPTSVSDWTEPASTPTPTQIIEPTSTQTNFVPHLQIFFADQKVYEILKLATGWHGVYIHEIGSPDYITFNPDQQLHGASTIKIAIAVVTIKVAEENNINLFAPLSTDKFADLDEAIWDMLVYHNDNATNFLIDYVNKQGYRFDTVLQNMGINGFNINERLTTARSMGMLMEGLQTNSLGIKQGHLILEMLNMPSKKDTATFNWTINDSLPGNYTNMVGAIYDANIPVSRLGTVRFVAAESGIWTTPGGHKFVIVMIGNYDSSRGFYTENTFIKKITAVLSDLSK